MTLHADWLRPVWQGRDSTGIGAVMTTRAGGMSRGPYASLNLRHGVGDEPVSVAANQARFADAIGAIPVWLNQVHGTRVLRLTSADIEDGARSGTDTPAGTGTDVAPTAATASAPRLPPADASVTSLPGIACTVQVADCLPVLFAAPGGRAVGAAHAGWRGLAAGVLEATLAAVCEAAGCRPDEVGAWLGACIGPNRFEVGEDVLRAFGAEPVPGVAGDLAADARQVDRGFRPHAPGKWLADLPLLARDRLRSAGVRDISGGRWCTVEDASRFFSFRRDRVTGRMAAAIWIEPRG